VSKGVASVNTTAIDNGLVAGPPRTVYVASDNSDIRSYAILEKGKILFSLDGHVPADVLTPVYGLLFVPCLFYLSVAFSSYCHYQHMHAHTALATVVSLILTGDELAPFRLGAAVDLSEPTNHFLASLYDGCVQTIYAYVHLPTSNLVPTY
jgi:hypothetical protein